MNWGAIVVAAGRGTRFGRPKQFVEIGGWPMVAWSLRTFESMPEIGELVVVTEEEWIEPMRTLLAQVAPSHNSSVVSGGTSRQSSVQRGLAQISDACGAVLVHDGARPLIRADDVRCAMRAVRPGRAAVLASAVVDTIKVVDSESMLVRRTLDRGELWAAQTPQLAMRRELERAHVAAQRAHLEATDDVALLESIGIEVQIVPSSNENFKITHPQDVARAQALLSERAEHAPREEEILLVEVFADEATKEAHLRRADYRVPFFDEALAKPALMNTAVPLEALRTGSV